MTKTLLVGYKAADIVPAQLDGEVTCHVLDIYHRHAIERVHRLRAVCSPHLPEGPWDVIRFKTGPKLMSGELALDLMQEIHRLSPAAKLWGGRSSSPKVEIDFVGRERDRNDLVNKIRDNPGRIRDFAARWRSSVPGGPTLEFTSFPGCFCHRRQDEGGLSLAEVVAAELKRAAISGGRLLDMGCGCGLVGLLVKSVLPGLELTLVDSHARAIEAADLNARAFAMPAEAILADDGTPARMNGTFDIFVGNPPYYSDYRIADVFLATAQRALKPGGVCYSVCKNAAGLEPVQKRYFPLVEIIRRRTYSVLKSVKA